MTRSFRGWIGLALALVLVAGVTPLFAQAAKPAAAAPAAAKAQAPVFLTSCGQSPGAVTVGVFLRRLQVDYDLKETGTVKDLAAKPYKTLIIVTGSSLKGMGGAGVSIDEELGRAGALIAEAKKRGMMVIGAHVEGMERRARNAAPGDNSDEMSIDAVCPKSQMLIVRKDGDEDGRFTALGKKFNVPVVFYVKSLELNTVLKSVFGK
ncbi:MAG TPA: DUF6305 family protein [Vicinamibacterales bacterium]